VAVSSTPRVLWFVLAGVAFVVLATANAAGYRYGVSDQAFYIPVVVRALDPAAFPRDAALIDAQGHLMLSDEVLAAVARSTGLSLELLFLGAYLLSLALIWAGLALIGAKVYGNPWVTLVLAAAFTLRHRIPKTSANSFEPYFHPRMLAFGVGTLAVAAFLRRRDWLAVTLVGAGALLHVTTGLWFAVLIGTGLLLVDRRWRVTAIVATAAVGLFIGWALLTGPLAGRLTTMDATWLQAVATKDSLFASTWPVWAWGANLALLALLWWATLYRHARGIETSTDRGLAWGATALVAVFLLTLPAVSAGQVFLTQLQISRVFWLVDFIATVYVLAAATDLARTRPRVAVALAGVVLSLSIVRGLYIMTVEHPERSLFARHLPDSPWEDAMTWLRQQPRGVHVLADPGHGWKQGTSVRVSAERDVFLEEVKDSAVAIYSRDVAARVVERTSAIGDFAALTPDRALQLATRYQLDFLVTEADLALPVAYRNAQFRIYTLRRP
jgi:hypothetical protein